MGVEKIQYNVQEGVGEIGVFKLQLSVVRVGWDEMRVNKIQYILGGSGVG